jgi:hypothetical protein
MRPSTLRALCLAVALLVPACGGGGGSGGSGPAAITQNSSLAIAGAVLQGAALGSDVGAVADAGIRDDVGAASSGASPPGSDIGRSAPTMATRAAFGPTGADCQVDGSVLLSGDVATPGEYAVGDQVTADFMMCDEGDGFVFDGLLDLTVLALVGDLPGNDFDVGLDLVMDDLLADDGVDPIVYDGDGTLDYDVSQDPLVTLGLAGTSLTLTLDMGATSFTLMDYVSNLELDAGPNPDEYRFSASGRMTSSEFDGEVAYETTQDFEGVDGSPPMTGEMVITGAFDATITVDPVDDVDVDLLVDLDGNGNDDVLIGTTWTELGF